MGRGNRFGPCVGRAPEDAWWLARWFLARHADQEIVWDLFSRKQFGARIWVRLFRVN